MPVDIKRLRTLLEKGDEGDYEPDASEDSASVLLGAMPELLNELEIRQEFEEYADKVKELYPEGLLDKEVRDLLGTLSGLSERASPAPWEQHYAYNNGGMPTAFFKIPQHNGGKEVEMLAEDAELLVTLRNSLPILLKALKELEDARGALSNLSSSLGAGLGSLETTIPQFVERIEWAVQDLFQKKTP